MTFVTSNIEFKCRLNASIGVHALCQRVGGAVHAEHDQVDTYFVVPQGRLKCRESGGRREFIYYERLNTVHARKSQYCRTQCEPNCHGLEQLLQAALSSPVTVAKRRTVISVGRAILNVDTVEGLGSFLEVEVPVVGEDDCDAVKLATFLRSELAIAEADLIPFSYADLVLMQQKAAEWQAALDAVPNPGRLFLMDGVSGAGKTSLFYSALRDPSFGVQAVPRHTTRNKRPGANEPEYIFTGQREFHQLVLEGAFIEFRDFDFGMSYGLSWDSALSPLLSGQNGLGIIDLGNVRHVSELFPKATLILIDVPAKTVERRLRERGHNTEEQIQERLGNARLIDEYRPYYDFVIPNDDGKFDETLESLKQTIAGRASPPKQL